MRNIKFTLGVAATLMITAGHPALAQSPYTQPDDSWISINGTVVVPTADSFMLDYGDGTITVEMDDWDAWGDAYGLMDGDQVTVYGDIDADLFEKTTIEASSVYVEGLNTYFDANSADEEGAVSWTVTTPIVISQTTIRGNVTAVDEMEGEFTVNTGDQEMTVETELLTYNPLDDLGYQQIDVNDRVSVTGMIDRDFLEGRVLDAEVIITLQDESAKS
jgi:uncharacterized protein YdeI (BOF family)